MFVTRLSLQNMAKVKSESNTFASTEIDKTSIREHNKLKNIYEDNELDKYETHR